MLAGESLGKMLPRETIAFSNNVLSMLIWRKSVIWIDSENRVVLLFSRNERKLFQRVEFEKFSKLLEFQIAFS